MSCFPGTAKTLFLLFLLALLPTITPAVADDSSTLQNIGNALSSTSVTDTLTAAAQSVPALLNLVQAAAFVIGVFGAAASVHSLVKRSTPGHEHHDGGYGGAIAGFFISMLLVSLGTTMQVLLTSFDPSQTVLSYTAPTGTGSTSTSANFCLSIEAVVGFIVLIGWLGFLRGWVMMRHAAQGMQGVSMEAGLVFIVGGVIAANICWWQSVLSSTTGVNVLTLLSSGGSSCGC